MHPDHDLADRPASTTAVLLDFDSVEIVTLESFPPQYVLIVSGTKPYRNMQVTLEPYVYVRRPEYWGIAVVGRIPGGVGLPALAPYEATLRLTGIIGTRGIEVIGASRSERHEIGEQPADTLRFRRDDRPVDGELREITIAPDGESTYTATLHTAHQDRTSPQQIETTTVLASRLTCTISDELVSCSRDDRPVDGVLKELVVAKDAEGTYDATLRTAYFDRRAGVEVDETEDVGSDLTKV